MKLKKKNAVTFFRFLVAAALLISLLFFIDTQNLGEVFLNINFFWIFIAFFFLIISAIVMSYRWHYLLLIHGLKQPFKTTLKITLLSAAFGSALPGGMGQDVIRAYQMIDNIGKIISVSSSIIIDRFIGLYSMLFLAFISSLILQSMQNVAAPVFILFILQFAFVFAWVILLAFRVRIGDWLNFKVMENNTSIICKSLRFFHAITDIRIIRTVFLRSFLLSILAQLIRCLIFFFLFLALGEHVNLLLLLLIVPLVFIIKFIPVSIGGLGVREGALIYFGGLYGVRASICFSAGILSHILPILLPLVTVIIWIAELILKPSQVHP
jgi:uncharacterized protein (TIRG00374 family)